MRLPGAVGGDGDGQQFAYDLIVADIPGDLPAEPGLERRRDQPQLPVRVGLGDHQPPLDGREMRHVRRPGEQAIDQPPPLLRARVLEELVRLSGRRDPAGEVERHPAEELGVVGRRRRLDAMLGPACGNQAVDRLHQQPRGILRPIAGPGAGPPSDDRSPPGDDDPNQDPARTRAPPTRPHG